MTLDEKVAVITGGGQGLGRAITLALARAGSKVVVVDMNLGTAESVAAEVTQAGGEALAVQVDVADEASVEALRDRTLGRWNRVDILINNAGMYPRSWWWTCRRRIGTGYWTSTSAASSCAPGLSRR